MSTAAKVVQKDGMNWRYRLQVQEYLLPVTFEELVWLWFATRFALDQELASQPDSRRILRRVEAKVKRFYYETWDGMRYV
ncbi:hypothetical protein [Pelomicrobium methylotrophicum]|uniref:Uncharacterized protein n=1 Tax=Pelomicrobium methylotrophicum TaxID=2602750 RepID=A0A5C7F2A0_9PROT|nr:hypothetical protein [Pelomicrobium methylotrophicum]TXF13627.1 hypothetical protein FR698_00480 [Pelomicrobium methylotrophicum]